MQRPAGAWARFKAAVKRLKHDVLALYYAVHDPRTPLLSKLLPWLVLAYALSPLDLIPDFIPILGDPTSTWPQALTFFELGSTKHAFSPSHVLGQRPILPPTSTPKPCAPP